MNQSMHPHTKLKIFISSICGVERYDNVRYKLKDLIEQTNLADVYMFEDRGASTLSAEAHYVFALKDCDVCIFLIDNADGINPGVQREIDTVKKYNIKALYYFCDEIQKEKTLLEQNLMGAQYAKSKTVHCFEDLSADGAQALIDDIVTVYHYYCQNIIDIKPDNEDIAQKIDLVAGDQFKLQTIQKSVLKNIDKSSDYIMKLVFGQENNLYRDGKENTCEIDEWCARFLTVMFEGKSITEFNAGMFLDALKKEHDETYYQCVSIRWQAIQAYFMGDIKKCTEYLEKALEYAKQNHLPTWVIKDILIDLRNQQFLFDNMSNCYRDSEAQRELTDSTEELYYPVMDRISESLQEEYVQGIYKKKLKSPYTYTIGRNWDQTCQMLASLFVIAMYNGSLTHIDLFYEKIRDFLFYLTTQYDDWKLEYDLYKLAIFIGKKSEIKGIRDSYSDVSNYLDSNDAVKIMEFCNNHPVAYKRFRSQLYAFGAVGYYLNEKDYVKYEKIVLDQIMEWIESKHSIVTLGSDIFQCLLETARRIPQDTISQICCLCMEKGLRRWYSDIFKLLANYVDYEKMSQPAMEQLISQIITVLDEEKDRNEIRNTPTFLCIMRKANRQMTEELDAKIAEVLPDYYAGTYRMETTENVQEDLPPFMEKYIAIVKDRNETQGKNGRYAGYGVRHIETLRLLLLMKDFQCPETLLDDMVRTVGDTVLFAKESISTKIDAIALLLCIIFKYPNTCKRNREIYEKIYDNYERIEGKDHRLLSSNVDSISLKIALQLLYTAMDKETYMEMLDLMPYIQNNASAIIAVSNLIVKYMEVQESVSFSEKTEALLLQTALQWIRSENVDVRWNAVRMLLKLWDSERNCGIINKQLVKLVDEDCVYIKNLIMRQIKTIPEFDVQTREYILNKCKNDDNYLVRMVAEEMGK